MPVMEIIVAVIGAVFGGWFYMLRIGRKNPLKKPGDKNQKGHAAAKAAAAARKADADRQAPISREKAATFNMKGVRGITWRRHAEKDGGGICVDKDGRAVLDGKITHSGLTHRRVLGAFYANEMDDPTKGVKATEDAFRHHVYMESASTGDKGKCPICAPGKGKQAPPLAAPTPAAKKSSVPASAG